MVIFRKASDVKFLTVAAITLASINFWSFQGLGESFYKFLETASILVLLVIVLSKTGVFTRKYLHFKVVTLLFIFIPFASMISSSAFHNQPFGLSFLTVRVTLLWLLYFVLHIYNIPVERIIKLLIFIGCVWAFLTIVQQYTYPNYFFFTRADDDKKSIYRAGVYRYMIMGVQYGVFVLLYFFYKYITLNRLKYIAFILLGVLGLYFFGTRQNLVAAGACMMISIFYLSGISKWKYLFLFGIGFSLVIMFSSSIFGELVDMTASQLDDEDYIRFLAADFFMNDYWPHWTAKILGNGRAHGMSPYGREMELYRDIGYHRSDIGIIGAYSEFGILYVLNILGLFLTGIFLKFKDKKDKYLKLFFFYFAMLLMLSLDFSYGSAIPFYCLLFYVIDKTLHPETQPAKPAVKQEVKLSQEVGLQVS